MSGVWTKTISQSALQEKRKAVVRRGGRQIALFDTPDGIYACNNRCPHEGYPLREGTLDEGCTLTCNWHNWKFDLRDGSNLYGGDRLRTYPVELRNGDIWVDLSEAPVDARRAVIMKNLRDAFDDHSYDRIAREIARLRLLGADPTEAVAAAIAWSYDRFEYGWSHAYAGAADWLVLHDEQSGDHETQLVCLMEIVGHIAEDILRRGSYPFSEESRDYDEDAFVQAIDEENEGAALSLLRGALDTDMSFSGLERGFARAALAHYADFGHALIYVTKAGRLIERLGTSVAWPVLASLVRSLVYSRREDQIPEFRYYSIALKEWQRSKGGKAAALPDAGVFHGLNVKQALKLAARHGAAEPEAFYRVLLAANADNMLAYDMTYQEQTDRSFRDNVGWLDFTHAITFANAVRQECEKFPELWPQGLLQMACFSGRNAPYTDPALDTAQWRVREPASFIDEMVATLYDHGQAEYIVSVHFVKTLLAARSEIRSGAAGEAAAPLAAALNRLINSPLKRKHTRRTARQAMKFVALDG